MGIIKRKIGIIGAGNMGEALIKGLLSAGLIAKPWLFCCDKSLSRRKYIQKKYKISVFPSNDRIAQVCRVIILAVKPQDMDAALGDIKDKNNKETLIISIAAGINTKYIQKKLPGARVIRVMPNTPALAGYGVSVIAKGNRTASGDYNLAKRLFSCIGIVAQVDESLMDVVTAVSGSGPAYFFLLIDSITKAASSMGLSSETAQNLIVNTALGSCVLALQSNQTMDALIKKVASKGGTTEAALKVFNKKGFSNMVEQALRQAAKRSKELSK
ncbi:MAG: pyrroline-5-carboxylate reductase [Candidatus Omnitrophota bacterium]